MFLMWDFLTGYNFKLLKDKYCEIMSNNRFSEIHESFLEIVKFEYFAKPILYFRDLQITCIKMINNILCYINLIFFQTLKNGLNFDDFPKIAH